MQLVNNMELFVFLFIVYVIYCTHTKNSNNDLYEYFYPDERQYIMCNNKNSKGDSNISMKENKPNKSISGFFTSILKETGEKKEGKHFNIHMCLPATDKNKKEIDYIYNNKIIDHQSNPEGNQTLYDSYNYHYSPYGNNYAVTYEINENGDFDSSFNDEFIRSFNKIKETDDRF